MAQTLEFSDTSAQTVKIGDTTTSFTMVLGEDSNPVDLTNATNIVAKLGNNTGYLKSQTITTDNIQDLLSGKVIIKFDADFMSGLPAGYYLLEVWVTYDSGTAIYPSGDLTGFTINNNIESSTGSTITTITFDDFVKAMNKAASTIAKGDTGVGVSSSTVTYQLSSSGTTTPTGTWSSSVLAQTTALPYLWTKTVITYSNSTTTTMYSVSSKGDTGPQGPKGADAVINVVTQAQYDALTDKTGLYVIQG